MERGMEKGGRIIVTPAGAMDDNRDTVKPGKAGSGTGHGTGPERIVAFRHG
jgi:hypothetical protein